ncbi:putative Aminotransferase class I and II [Trypanosoma vivax]|uniref:aspartate transaminase n=1 Tax=Trypanosoma vivax (strain Y486) TaxID=1055687 RepID=G0UB53_TRYVY|nr:putative Aminotransferase class I and II [Trypanosoma vivax]CCC53040.1 putative aspartate aminotransferase, mitochondrial [Trypanosoma vivax Y486]
MRRVRSTASGDLVALLTGRATFSAFSGIAMCAPDSILGIVQDFRRDPAPNKVNLAIGVYRDDANRPFVLESVKRADTGADMEYSPVIGIPAFLELSQKLCFGETCTALRDGRVASCQALGGTGALRLGGELLRRFVDNCPFIYGTDVGYANHPGIFSAAGINLKPYAYYNASTRALNLHGMLQSLEDLPERSVVLLHACAHNPTGVDPTMEEWKKVCEVLERRKHLPFVDMAYQGFATGDVERDGFLPRYLVDRVPNLIVAQSFSKSFGLYGHRCGALHVVAGNSTEAKCIASQLAVLIRSTYSNPPLYGARVVASILNSPELRALWLDELRQMSDRIASVRKRLVQELKTCGSSHDWSHIERQIGMMAFTGLSKEQVLELRDKHKVYMTLNGRAAVSGLNTMNVAYVARAIHDVTK